MIPPKPNQSYHPRVFGFRVNQASLYYTNREEDARAHQQRQGDAVAGRQGRRSRRLHGASGGVGAVGAVGPPSATFSLTSGASGGILSGERGGGAVGAPGLAIHGGGGPNHHPRR